MTVTKNTEKNIYLYFRLPYKFYSMYVTYLVVFFFFFFLFMGAPAAYGSSKAKGHIRAVAAGLCHSHGNTYIAACGNTDSLTH